MNRISLNSGQIAALALTLFLLVASWLWVLHPIYSGAAAAIDQLAEARFELGRLELIAKKASPLTLQHIAQRYNELSPFVFESTPNSAANAQLLNSIETILQSSDVTLIQLRTSLPTKKTVFNQLAIDLTVSATEPSFMSLLSRIESARPILIIDSADIQVIAPGTETIPPTLSAQFRVTALSRPAASLLSDLDV